MEQQEWESLRGRYPSWRIRPSREGNCLLATRLDRNGLNPRELEAGLCMTLIEDSPDQLIRSLVIQTEIERRL